MELYKTLTDLLADARSKDREIQFIDGENDESVVSFGDLWNRAVALLGSLQAHGMKAGDELVIFSKSNESFVIAFWAAVLGGMVPVPVAVGISDEHRLIVLLHDTEGYKLEEIQGLIGVPIGTVKSRLHRARTRLREILRENGTFSADPSC